MGKAHHADTVVNATESGTQMAYTVLTDVNGGPVLPTVSLSIDSATINETTGSATVTATLSAVYGSDVTVNLIFSGTALNSIDYSASATSFTISAGNLTDSLVLTPTGDTTDEPDETVIIDISTVSGDCKVLKHDEQTVKIFLTYNYKPTKRFEPIISKEENKLIIKEKMYG